MCSFLKGGKRRNVSPGIPRGIPRYPPVSPRSLLGVVSLTLERAAGGRELSENMTFSVRGCLASSRFIQTFIRSARASTPLMMPACAVHAARTEATRARAFEICTNTNGKLTRSLVRQSKDAAGRFLARALLDAVAALAFALLTALFPLSRRRGWSSVVAFLPPASAFQSASNKTKEGPKFNRHLSTKLFPMISDFHFLLLWRFCPTDALSPASPVSPSAGIDGLVLSGIMSQRPWGVQRYVTLQTLNRNLSHRVDVFQHTLRNKNSRDPETPK